MTFKTVANSGLPSADNALYRLSRPSPAALAILDIPLARATSPSAAATSAGSPSSRTASRYSIISLFVLRWFAASHLVVLIFLFFKFCASFHTRPVRVAQAQRGEEIVILLAARSTLIHHLLHLGIKIPESACAGSRVALHRVCCFDLLVDRENLFSDPLRVCESSALYRAMYRRNPQEILAAVLLLALISIALPPQTPLAELGKKLKPAVPHLTSSGGQKNPDPFWRCIAWSTR